MTKILVITSTRADFGLLKNLINSFKKNKFDCKVLVSGTHFSKYYGYTSNEIKSENIKIDFKLKQEIITKILSTKLFVGIGLISYSFYFCKSLFRKTSQVSLDW